jgi:hypothetical protein
MFESICVSMEVFELRNVYAPAGVYAWKGTFVTNKKGGIHFKFLPELIKIEIWLDLNDGIKSLSFREIIWKVCRNKIT